MMVVRVMLALALAVIIAVPLAMRPRDSGRSEGRRRDEATLVIVTPHVQQIRIEVGEGFERWAKLKTGQSVRIDWRSPGGTSEILKLLEAQYAAAIKGGLVDFADEKNPRIDAGVIGFDLMFGGGSYDHGRLKAGVSLEWQGVKRSVPMSSPAGIDKATLEGWFGENAIGVQKLYDEEQYWIGTALSSFGIVYNEDVLERAGLTPPKSFRDLGDPRYAGLLSLADPRQSGSVTTTMESILNNEGWDEGWRILRAMSANARTFSGSATKPPIDVGSGEAGAGLAIDFYGRVQAASVRGGAGAKAGGKAGANEGDGVARVGYVDPVGAVYIDADPVSILRGGPRPDLARLFVEYCLTLEAQALWQFPAITSEAGAKNPRLPAGEVRAGEAMGPRVHELHRLPVRRAMYQPEYRGHFTDDADPFAAASRVASKRWRSAIALMFGAFAIDVAPEQRAAWAAVARASEAARARGSEAEAKAKELERLFFAWPSPEQVGATYRVLFGEEAPAAALRVIEPGENNATFKELDKVWKDKREGARLRVVYTEVFKQNYREIVRRVE